MSALDAVRAPATERSRPVGSAPGGALVLGADYRGLGVVRSLGRRGVPVWVLKEAGEPLASTSRYARRSLAWPPEGEDRVAFLCDLAESKGIRGWALVPTADETAALVAQHHDELAEHFTHTVAPWNVVRWAHDKRLTYELAERVGVPCPRTFYPRTRDDLAAADVLFPAVIKPTVKESFNRLTAAKAWRVDGKIELLERYAEACTLVDPGTLMVQELVPGGGDGQFSYAALCVDGEPVAQITARRTRQYPADFGRASTYVETVDCPELLEPSLTLLRELRFDGLIEIEFKRDPRDGVLKVLDMNPRVWGWQSLCGRAGVDFPYLLWLLVSGAPVPRTQARAGVGWLRFTTDTPTVLKELYAKRLRLRDYLRSLRRPRESAIFAWDDPVPGLAELPLVAILLCRRLLRGDAV
jgi:D-aspartate ligase